MYILRMYLTSRSLHIFTESMSPKNENVLNKIGIYILKALQLRKEVTGVIKDLKEVRLLVF